MRAPRQRRLRLLPRLVAVIVALGSATALGGLTLVSCGTDAAGIEACRDIEAARCEASASCGMSAQAVIDCKAFYHDQCLDGIENNTQDGGPSQPQVDDCVHDVKLLETCIKGHGKTMADCTGHLGVPLAPGLDPATLKKAPCEVLQHEVEDLAACAFILAPADAGVPDVNVVDVVEEDVFIL